MMVTALVIVLVVLTVALGGACRLALRAREESDNLRARIETLDYRSSQHSAEVLALANYLDVRFDSSKRAYYAGPGDGRPRKSGRRQAQAARAKR